jgi:hypothetical protein
VGQDLLQGPSAQAVVPADSAFRDAIHEHCTRISVHWFMSVRTLHPDLAAWLASSREASGPGRTEPGMVGRHHFRPAFTASQDRPFVL